MSKEELLKMVIINITVPKWFKNDLQDHIAIIAKYRSVRDFVQEAIEEKMERDKPLVERLKLAIARSEGLHKMVPQGQKKTGEDIVKKKAGLADD